LSSFTVSLQAALHLPFIIKAAFKQSLKKPLTFPLNKKNKQPCIFPSSSPTFSLSAALKKSLKKTLSFPLEKP